MSDNKYRKADVFAGEGSFAGKLKQLRQSADIEEMDKQIEEPDSSPVVKKDSDKWMPNQTFHSHPGD